MKKSICIAMFCLFLPACAVVQTAVQKSNERFLEKYPCPAGSRPIVTTTWQITKSKPKAWDRIFIWRIYGHAAQVVEYYCH